ncbi:MAG TPA: 8-oxoguanine deaminase [Acidimicrobiia bacterium]|nr:8-oxoguanine deaminase [Acidimicrobiia bacterium]
MPTLLVRNATVLVTMDDGRREISGGGLFARDGVIEQVGPSDELPGAADRVVDASGLLVLPGLINTHHHFFQTLTRVVPGAQDAPLFDWLRCLYPVWANLDPESVRVATTLALLELAKSGCTTAFDHQYLWPNGSRVDDQLEGAEPVGIRFHASRGSMSLSEKDGGLPPDSVVQDHDTILEDTTRVIDAFHDPSPGAMVQVAVSPCSPFTVTEELMRDSAALARDKGVQLHTHLAETRDEERFTLERFGKRPVDYAADLDWLGDDVWFAHAVFVASDEITRMAATGTGMAHCPSSNMRLASGIAPVAGYRTARVPVGLGVDGSASNDSSNLLAEARQALLLGRLAVSPGIGEGAQMGARTALEIATRGGAEVLGRNDIGALEVGRMADFFTLDLNRVEFSGALQDPVAAAVMCSPVPARDVFVAGTAVIEERQHSTIDEGVLVEEHNRAAATLMG